MRAARPRLGCLVLAACLPGCDLLDPTPATGPVQPWSPPFVPPDAGGRGGPVEPEAPAPPSLADWACPDGWLSEPVEEGEAWAASICRTPPRVLCRGSDYQLPGDAACRTLGTACPEDDGLLPEDEARALAPGFAGEVLYVRGGDAPAGSGSRADPWDSLATALPRADAGAVIVLAPGRYREAIELTTRVAVVGSCAAGTVIEAPTASSSAPTVRMTAAGTLLANLTVRGEREGVGVEGGSPAGELREVLIDGPHRGGVRVVGSRAVLTRVVIRGVGLLPGSDTAWAVGVAEHGEVRARGLALLDVAGAGFSLLDAADGEPSRLDAADLVVTQASLTGGRPPAGACVEATGAADVAVSRALLLGCRGAGILVEPGQASATLTLADLHVSGLVAPDSAEEGGAVVVRGAVEATLTRVLVEGVPTSDLRFEAVAGDQRFLTASLSDVAVLDSAQGTERSRASLQVLGSVLLDARRIYLARTILGAVRAVAVPGAAPRVGLEDLLVRDGWAPEGSVRHAAVEALGAASLTLARAALLSPSGSGLALIGVEGAGEPLADVRDLTARSPRCGNAGCAAHLVVAAGGASLTLVRARLEQTTGAGVALLAPPGAIRAELSDVTVDAADNGGLHAWGNVSLGAERIAFSDCGGAGLVAGAERDADGLPLAPAPSISVAGLTVRGTRCTPDGLAGVGLGVLDGARALVTRASVTGCHGVGVGAASAGRRSTLLLDGLSVADTAACAQDDGLGVLLDRGADAMLTDFAVTGSASAGLALAGNAAADATAGAVYGNATGVVLAATGLDEARVLAGTSVSSNGRDLVREPIPLPDLRTTLTPLTLR